MKEKQNFTLQELAQVTQSTLMGDPDYCVNGFADLESARESDVSFLSNPRYTSTRYTTAMKQSKAGAIFVTPAAYSEHSHTNFLLNEDPSHAFQQTIQLMLGNSLTRTQFESIHSSAVIHETCSIGNNVSIGPNAVIDSHVVIDEGTVIGAGVYIGPETTIGKNCTIYPNVTIQERCRIGNHVMIQSGTVIGSCGFGFSTDKQGRHTRIAQIGTVVIEDNVEIGSNCTIDRARFTETRIGQGSKLDTQVVIGHNVIVGRHNLICGQSAIAGSTKTGNFVAIAGQCGIDGHLSIEDGVMISAKSGVTKSLKKGKYGGYPAQLLSLSNRNHVHFKNLDKYVELLKQLQMKLLKPDEADD